MAIDWDTTPHYTIRFTSAGEAEMTGEDGAPHEAFNAATSRGLKLSPDQSPELSLLTIIAL